MYYYKSKSGHSLLKSKRLVFDEKWVEITQEEYESIKAELQNN